MFQLIGYADSFTPCGTTSHGVNRSKRLQIAERLIIEERAKVIRIAVVNKGHENGNEIHVIFNNGIIKVYNARTRKFITVLIARVPQVERPCWILTVLTLTRQSRAQDRFHLVLLRNM